MLIDVRFAEIHAPLFLSGNDGGFNLGMKLDPSKRKGLVLQYDRANKELVVTFNGMKAIVPGSNVASFIPEDRPAAALKVTAEDVRAAQTADTAIPSPLPTGASQVDTPQSHVFAGPGKGKTRS